MKEQVKEWIVDKNLTTDSFDSIMIGVIYNSGHSTLDDPDVRKWIETHPNEFRLMLPPKLTDDQQVILDWLKEEYAKNEELTVFGTLSVFFDETDNHFMSLDVIDALYELTDKQQAQVLKVFSEWALEQEEE